MKSEEEVDGKGYVHCKTWKETYANLVDETYRKKLTLEKCTELAHRWHDNTMIAKDGDKVIGFVGYGAYRGDSLPEHGEVFGFYVLKDYQGKKVGYDLMKAAFHKLSDYKKIAVWVLKGNDRVIRFYEQYGFRFDGEHAEISLGTPNTELRMIYERS